MSYVVAVDLGATKTSVALFRGSTIERKVTKPTPRGVEPQELVEYIVGLIREVSGDIVLETVGIAAAGPLDLERGMIIGAPNMDPSTFELRDPIGESLGVRVVLANDCVAAVWGEYVLGGWSGIRDQVYVTISTGIGGGAIVDGRLVVGRRGNAHEIGHIVVDYESRLRCGCGGLGHWEALASGSGIPALAKLKAKEWGGPATPAYERAAMGKLTPVELYGLARSGDAFALKLVDYINRIHAAGLAGVIAVYDPQVIHMGGSIFLENRDLMMEGLKKYLPGYSLFGTPTIRPATFGKDAPLYGAAAIAINTPEELRRYEYTP